MVLRIDLETKSDVDLIGCGVYRYVESEHTDVLMASYKIDGPVRRWKRGEPCPADIVEHVRAGRPIKAWNAAFERMSWWNVLCVKHGWPKPALEQFHCSAVTAAAMSLPRSLDRCGEALDLPIKKSKAGAALIRFFSIPIGWRDGKPVFNEPEDHPQKFAEFQDYCDQDVLAEEAIDNRLVPLSDYEQKVYWLNERINDRGLRIDVKSARAALEIVEKAKHHVNAELADVTGGYVTAVSQAAALKRWVESRGIHIPSMAEHDVDEYLHEVDDLPADVRRVLELRQEGGKSSLAKIETMLKRAGRDNRARGEYLHHGAGQTGRFSSSGIQVHNMPRYRKVFEDAKLDLNTLFSNINTASPQWLVDSYGAGLGRPLHILADAVRSFIWAAPGKVLLDADYASIEGRAAAWFAREDWKMQAYRELDAGHGHDMYKQAAAPIYNVPVAEVTKQQRQVGKVAELALGYNGGVGALSKMARMNKLKLGSVYQPVWESAPIERRETAMGRLEERKEKNDPAVKELGDEAWISAELIKVGWRAANPKITAAWAELNDAAYAAVQNPGSVQRALFGKVAYLVDNGFLWCLLPSGRCLAYGSPRIDDVEAPWADKTQPKELRETKKTVTVLGVDSQTKRWYRFSIYGGSLFNNCLSGETNVLTPLGWKRLDEMTTEDLVFDGVQWVQHQGLICQGVQRTTLFGGVRLTYDHKILTPTGWKEARNAQIEDAKATSPSLEFAWSRLRGADCDGLRRIDRQQDALECALHLRDGESSEGRRSGQGSSELRVPCEKSLSAASDHARNVVSPGLHLLAKHACTLQRPRAPRIQELRRAWHNCVRRMVEISSFLAGYGADLAARAYAGAGGQQQRVRPAELCVEVSPRSGQKHPKEPSAGHAEGAYVGLRSRGNVRHQHDNVALPSRCGLAGSEDVRPAGLGASGDGLSVVYDLVNAGPLHRFTVQADDGAPFIVSNCVQGSCRDILVHGMMSAEAAGYEIVLHTHDEMAAEIERDKADVAAFEKLICELPAWAEGLPLTSSGFRSKRYRKD